MKKKKPKFKLGDVVKLRKSSHHIGELFIITDFTGNPENGFRYLTTPLQDCTLHGWYDENQFKLHLDLAGYLCIPPKEFLIDQ